MWSITNQNFIEFLNVIADYNSSLFFNLFNLYLSALAIFWAYIIYLLIRKLSI